MLFVKRRRILVTCSRRLENPAGLRLSPSLSFFLVSGILVMQMRGGGTSQPLYKGGRAGRPAAGRPGVYSCKFPNRKYIFVKNENKKYKNKKNRFGYPPAIKN